MLTKEQIADIMNELGLDLADATSRQIIEQVASSKPNVTIDAHFMSVLREQLKLQADKIGLQMNNQPTSNHSERNIENTSNKKNNLTANFMNKILVPALVVALILVSGGLWYTQQSGKPLVRTKQNDIGQLLSGEYNVTNLQQESFGNLAKLAIVNADTAGNLEQNQSGVSVGVPEKNNSVSDTPTSVGGEEKLIAPNFVPTNFEFKYDGGAINNLPATQDVLKRTKPQQPSTLVSRILNFLSFGLLDLTQFTDVKMQNFSFVEDHTYGYGFNVDIMQGSVSMYQNWEQWPQSGYGACGGSGSDMEQRGLSSSTSTSPTEPCTAVKPLQPEDMPNNEELFKVTNDFLKMYKVSLEAYGQPRVIGNWRAQYASATDHASIWIPEQLQVIYPLVLDGKEVMDESGNPSGLNLMVDVRSKRVVSLYDLDTKQFERSQYNGEVDAKRIVDIAERGGFRNYQYNELNGKRVVLDLDTPTLELVKIWYSDDSNRTPSELFVPAYVFPIKDWEKSGYWRKNVIVPLVKDILDNDTIGGGDHPMPIDAVPDSAPVPKGEPGGVTGAGVTSVGGAGASTATNLSGDAL